MHCSFLLGLVSLAVSAATLAQIPSQYVPAQIPLQGILTDSGGAPVPDGAKSLQFGLYDAASGGTALWSETQNVETKDGVYDVWLGSVTPIGIGFHRKLWLGIAVGGSAELSPRVPLAAAPYAFGLAGLRVVPSAAGKAPTLIGGADDNVAPQGIAGAVIAGGGSSDFPNQLGAHHSVIGGGNGNRAGLCVSANSCEGTTVGGGIGNEAGVCPGQACQYSTIGGGHFNRTTAMISTVAGGGNNHALAQAATVAGGYGNVGQGEKGTVAGGWYNEVAGNYGTVGGGSRNHAFAPFSTIGGGGQDTGAWADSGNTVFDPWGTIGGGFHNRIGNDDTFDDSYATIGGGANNVAVGQGATIAGGTHNGALALHSTVGGGLTNHAEAFYATIAGGYDNQALSPAAFIGGGTGNAAQQPYAAVGAGVDNLAYGSYAFIGGGSENLAGGEAATVPGGHANAAAGAFSFAAGHRARALHEGSFVWNDRNPATDSPADNFDSTQPNQFLISATGGVGIGTNAPDRQLTVYKEESAYANIKDNSHELLIGVDANGGVLSVMSNHGLTLRTGANVDRMHLSPTGNVGIGTVDPSAALHLLKEGPPPTGLAAEQNGLLLGTVSPTSYKWIQSYGGVLSVNPMGNNVGIGTEEPQEALDVNGNIRAVKLIETSDARFKTGITTLKNGLELVEGMRGVRYRWNREAFPERGFEEGDQIGLIGQEVEALLPELVSTDSRGYRAIEYGKVVAVLVEAIKELKVEIDQLKVAACTE